MRFLNVIIVDDDRDDCELLEQAIIQVYPSLSCVIYNDAEKALIDLTGKTPESTVIFLDLNMPRMDGVQFLEVMRGRDNLKDIPVIIFSTSPLIEASKSKLLNIMGSLEKPNSFQSLVENLKTVLV